MKKEIPILMSAPMVQAIIDGRKTMTRRVMKPQPDFEPIGWRSTHSYEREAKWQPGDILWVRESWQWWNDQNQYKADQDSIGEIFKCPLKFKPSIHMPKVAARIWLEVTEVRIERLQDISEQDAIAEGIMFYIDEHWKRPRYKDYLADASGYGHPDHDYPTVGIAVTSFSTLWCKINGEKSWYLNPWVWVISFRVLSKNGKPRELEAILSNETL
jgi:hypothetical protein